MIGFNGFSFSQPSTSPCLSNSVITQSFVLVFGRHCQKSINKKDACHSTIAHRPETKWCVVVMVE